MSFKSGFEYYQCEDGIYHMSFYDHQKTTIDGCFRCLEQVYAATPPNQQVRLLLDARPSTGLMLMLKYITDKSRELNSKLKRPRLAVAIVIETTIFSRVLDTTLRVFIRSDDALRIFDLSQYDTAVEWLQQAAATAGD